MFQWKREDEGVDTALEEINVEHADVFLYSLMMAVKSNFDAD